MTTALLVAALLGQAQPSTQPQGQFVATRLEMGDRLKRLEAEWILHRDASRRMAAIPSINQAVQSFFGGQFREACAALDRATSTLTGIEDPTRALDVRVFPPAVQPGQEYTVRVSWAYPGKSDQSLTVDGKPFRPGETVEFKRTAPAANGRDQWLNIPLPLSVRGEKATRVALIPNFADRLEELEGADEPAVQAYEQLLRDGLRPDFETQVDFIRVLAEAEALRSGRLRLEQIRDVPLAIHQGVRMRARVPSGAKVVVIALHGAGGSENMFFETYGAGLAAKLAQERGWAFVAPRSGAQSVGAALSWLREVRKLKPERVFVMGHSMGGGIALQAAQSEITAKALFAPAAGRPPEKMATPTFLAVGEQEMAMLRRGAEALAEAWKGQPGFEFNRVNASEHLMIVADALPEAYKFLDRHAPSR